MLEWWAESHRHHLPLRPRHRPGPHPRHPCWPNPVQMAHSEAGVGARFLSRLGDHLCVHAPKDG